MLVIWWPPPYIRARVWAHVRPRVRVLCPMRVHVRVQDLARASGCRKKLGRAELILMSFLAILGSNSFCKNQVFGPYLKFEEKIPIRNRDFEAFFAKARKNPSKSIFKYARATRACERVRARLGRNARARTRD